MFSRPLVWASRILLPAAKVHVGHCLQGALRSLAIKPPIFSLDLDLNHASQLSEQQAPSERETKKDVLSDILADIVFEPSGSESSELDRIFADLAKGPPEETDHYTNVTLDQTDEDVFEQESKKSDTIREEKRLFEDIFESYAAIDRETPKSTKLEDEVLWNLQQSFAKPSRKPSEQPFLSQTLSALVIKKCSDSAKIAILPTLDLLLAMEKQLQLVQFLAGVLDRYDAKDYDQESFYMHKLNSESTEEFEARAERLFDEAHNRSVADPLKPYLHEYTLPAMFNHIVRLLSNKFYNGQLAISLFNSVKKDIHLYTIMCNQETYNEMLKVYWIYMGKSSLCEIELLMVEMTTNGFRGDLTTFTILKEVMGEYHTMRMGKSLYNPGGAPIWSLEDEKRATKMGEKLRELGKYLRKSHP